MRPIGKLQDEAQARRFGAFLYGKGIENQVDPTTKGTWEIWVLDDANVETSTSLLEHFSRNPDDPAFVQVSRVAARQKQADEAAQTPRRNRVVDARMIFYTPPVPMGPLSMVLIAISIAVTVITNFSDNENLMRLLSISQSIEAQGFLPEVLRGQVWRLFTPMFLHFGIVHILFNMLWLRDLGSMIEARKNSTFLLVLTLVLAATSNVGQYLYDGPSFGGMSGVVYGLLGYIWMQGKFNPASKLSLQPQTVIVMILWFFICLSGKVGQIANTAHGVGLAVGIAWGFLDARLRVALRHY